MLRGEWRNWHTRTTQNRVPQGMWVRLPPRPLMKGKKVLTEYVKSSRERGVQEYFIRQALVDAGWNRDQVDDAMDSEEAWPQEARKDIENGGATLKLPKRILPKKHFIISLPRILSLIFVVAIIGMVATSFYQDRKYEIVLPDGEGNLSSFDYGSWPALEDVAFFEKVKQRFIDEEINFVESDLSAMTLRVYKEGEMIKEVPIASKGNEGSWWETPAGLYKIQGKEVDHFSSFGQVHMPWSMPFQGNFFIHGWPYYTNGQLVAQGYSGGCIRLSTEDAEAVFGLVEVGMPVLVYEKDFIGDSFKYELLGNKLTAQNYLAADLANNFAFAEKDSDVQVPIASLTKLMTAIVASEYINIEKEITITQDMLVETSIPRLYAGQKISVFNLLYPLLMESSNEAGVAMSRILGVTRFVDLMNEKADAIGMNDTRFVDPNGSGAENVSTVSDLFQLAKYIYNNRSFVLNISKGGATQSIYGQPILYGLQNFNVFVNDSEFVGGKVGMTTAAGETILSVFEFKNGGGIRPVVIIALGSENRAADAQTLLDYVRLSY